MKKTLLALCITLLAAAPASAVEYFGGNLQVRGELPVESAGGFSTNVATLAYSNTASFLGQAFVNGGTANQSGNLITRLVADDLTPAAGMGGLPVIQFTFSVANLNGAAVAFRPRVRFWNADGAGGAPGSYYSNPAAVGFTFNAVTVAASTVTLLTATLAPNQMNMPAGTFWAGITFDNNVGATGATQAQMDNIAQGIFSPPTVGSSTDALFQTTGAGSFFTIANPVGVVTNFSGNPVANFGWEFVVDQPVSTQRTSWNRVKSLYR